MIRSLPRLLAPLMAVVLALTGVTDAMARGHAPVVGHMVICSADGVTTIAVDADGNPAQGSHPCPDCTLSSGAMLPAAPVAAQPVPRIIAAVPARDAQCNGNPRTSQRHARAPPFLPV